MKRFGRRAAPWVVLLAGLVGCQATGANEELLPAVEEYPVAYQKAGKYCGMQEPLRLVVRDEAHMAFVPISDVPVDFGHQMVLFVTMGQVYSDAYGVRIDRVWRQGRQIKVGITETFPVPGRMNPPQPCSPYALVVVPRSDLNVDGFTADAPPAKPAIGPQILPAPSR